MGTNHFALVVYGASIDEVRDSATRWLGAKGFDPIEEPVTPLDPEHERGLQLRWNDRCVVALYGHFEEQDRLLFELRRLGRPVLEYWLHDSDVWGYTLWHDGAPAAGFVSDPDYGGVHQEAEGPDDVDALCRLTGADGAAVRAIQRRKAVFAEEIGAAFVGALGAGAAAAQYGDDPVADGFSGEDRWYRRHGWDPMKGFDLGSLRFRTLDQPGMTPEQTAEMAARMRRWQVIGRVLSVLFWPVRAGLGLWLRWRMWRHGDRIRASIEAARERSPAAFVVEGDRLVNAKVGCSITLAAGARVEEKHRHSVFPGAVFGFRAGSIDVFARAMLPSGLRYLETLGTADVTFTEEALTIGGRPARRVAVDMAQGRVRRLVIVHGPKALLVFEAYVAGPIDEASREAFDRTVETLAFE